MNVPRERAALIGRAVLALGITPLMFIIYMATGVPGIPALDVKSPSAQSGRGALVFVARASRTPVRARRRPPAAAPRALLAARKPQAISSVAPEPSAPADEAALAAKPNAAPAPPTPEPTVPPQVVTVLSLPAISVSLTAAVAAPQTGDALKP